MTTIALRSRYPTAPWASNLTVGQRVTVIGYYQGGNKITATTYNSQPLQEQLGVTPVYPLKEGMTRKMMQEIIKKLSSPLNHILKNSYRLRFRHKYRLLPKTALRCLHFPRPWMRSTQATRTLKYEEFLKFHLVLR